MVIRSAEIEMIECEATSLSKIYTNKEYRSMRGIQDLTGYMCFLQRKIDIF